MSWTVTQRLGCGLFVECDQDMSAKRGAQAPESVGGYRVVSWSYSSAPPAAAASASSSSSSSSGAGKRQRKGDGAGAAQAAVRYLYCKAHGANKKKKKILSASDEVRAFSVNRARA